VPRAVPFPRSIDVRLYRPNRLMSNLGVDRFRELFAGELKLDSGRWFSPQ
jgi:hypothetical protein